MGMLAHLISTVPAHLMREKLIAGVQVVLHCLNFRQTRASREKIEPILAWGGRNMPEDECFRYQLWSDVIFYAHD